MGCHGGYNRQNKSGRFNSRGFGIGSTYRRVRDWFDWMMPEAWNVEHNNLHHYRLGEIDDPDLVERNLEFLREKKVPMPLKYAFVGMVMAVWKWYYYAPNTFKELKLAEMRSKGQPIPADIDPKEAVTLLTLLKPKVGSKWLSMTEFLRKGIGPYLLFHFFLLPLPLMAAGSKFYWNAVVNLWLADIITNIHSFIVIVTNHAGDDLYRFESGCAPRSGTFYMRQVVSSANFRTGSNVNDFMHGWLNYQIEHHLWPHLSMLSYQRSQPELEALCAEHGVPYVQHSVFTRLKKTVDIMVGKTSMRRYHPKWESSADYMSWADSEALPTPVAH